ncbi:hypothetical protein BG015_004618 [Linnemannia schmuckeri]|uniref:TPR-like protein n=1 Tax=Linnemannia schmuckeri TaxID=64567 RepID=A0A9P5VCZ8_9FUNG|nr:hypothetical protein BG015_004618 [Linnemannia schmuckeri]
MGACCGKPDRKGQGYVLGASNTSSNASAPEQRLGTAAGKAKAATQQQQQSAGQTLGGGPTNSPRVQGELSQSALAAQKRAEAAENRGVQKGGGQLAKKLADKKKQSPYVVEESLPEPTNDAAATLLAGGSTFSRIRITPTLRPSTPFRNVRTSLHQRATTATSTRGYASISTNTTPPPTNFDSTAGLTPGARVIIATTRGVRNVLIFATSTLGLVLFAFTGTHAYLEQYKCPSPAGVSTEVQRCLHGAWVREEFSPDPDVAELYLQKAVELARKDLETHYANKNKGKEGDGKDERFSFLEIEKDQALVEIQNRLARFYGRIGRDEQAATVWTRLWKLSEKENPRPSTSSDSPSSGLGSLFKGGASANRPLISQKDGIPYAKSAADCWMRMGEYEMAEEALAWTLSTLASTTAPSSTSTTPSRIEEIGLLSSLGALYVRQAKFEYALSLFVKALQAVQDHRASETDSVETTTDEKKKAALKEDKDMWYCREAILTQSIGETLYGAATRLLAASSSTAATTAPATPETPETKKSSSWKIWSSSSSSSSSPSTNSKMTVPYQKSPEQIKKEEEALGWMQKALAMAKVKSGQHRDCDECAALGLNNLGLINEMEGKSEVALAQFREAVLHATMAKDYVGIDDYNRNIARLTERINDDAESTSTLA